MIVLACLRDHVGRLVHPAAQVSPVEAARHRMFIATRLTLSCVALALIPLYLVSGSVPGWLDAVLLAWLVLPLVAVAQVSNTGDLALGEAISATAWIGLALTLFLGHVCGIGPVCALLLVVPLEAAFSTASRVALAGTVAAMAALSGCLALESLGHGAAHGFGKADIVFLLFAGIQAASLGLRGCSLQQVRRDVEQLDAQRYRVLSEAIGDLVLRFDSTGLVMAASGAAERHFGIMPQDLFGRGFFERVHVADRPAFLTAVSDAANGTGRGLVEVRFRRSSSRSAEGSYEEPVFVWLELRTRQLDGEDAASTAQAGQAAVVSVVRDITVRKQHEAEVERAKQEAEQANASKDRFIATVSHELRTPLNAIIGFSEMLASETLAPKDPEKQRDYAQIVHTSGQHLLAVVNSLLDLSKLDAGKFELLCEPFDTAGLIQACCDMVSLKAEQSGISLRRDIADGLDHLIGDKRACKQIVLNLLSNALKFTSVGGSVYVSAKPDGNAVLISVLDTGIGMVARDLARLGDPFFQVHGSYDRPFEGTGLGLSVVKGLVGLHGGLITVESSPGEGTRITVRLPVDCRRAATKSGQMAKIEVITRYPRSAPPIPSIDPQKVQKIA